MLASTVRRVTRVATPAAAPISYDHNSAIGYDVNAAVSSYAASIATLYFRPAASSSPWIASRTSTDSG
jgi:hypothetical protein